MNLLDVTGRRLVKAMVALTLTLGTLGARGAETPPASPGRTNQGDATPAIPLVRAHSHNDYEHARPLLDALDHGFCSIEADVHLVDDQLLVAHDRNKTSPEQTLATLYLDPLRERARRSGGRIHPGGPVCLLFIDLKTEAEATYAALHRLLAGYPDLVTRFDGTRVTTNAVLVIISGNRPVATITAQQTRFAALDGRAPDLDSDVSPLLVPVVSDRWGAFFKWRGAGAIPTEELARLKDFVAKAKARGRRLRWWAAPDIPAAWQVLFDAGVDLINTDNHSGLRDFLLSRQRDSARSGLYDEDPRDQGSPRILARSRWYWTGSIRSFL